MEANDRKSMIEVGQVATATVADFESMLARVQESYRLSEEQIAEFVKTAQDLATETMQSTLEAAEMLVALMGKPKEPAESLLAPEWPPPMANRATRRACKHVQTKGGHCVRCGTSVTS